MLENSENGLGNFATVCGTSTLGNYITTAMPESSIELAASSSLNFKSLKFTKYYPTYLLYYAFR